MDQPWKISGLSVSSTKSKSSFLTWNKNSKNTGHSLCRTFPYCTQESLIYQPICLHQFPFLTRGENTDYQEVTGKLVRKKLQTQTRSVQADCREYYNIDSDAIKWGHRTDIHRWYHPGVTSARFPAPGQLKLGKNSMEMVLERTYSLNNRHINLVTLYK